MSELASFPGSPLRLDGLYRRVGALADDSPITCFLRFEQNGGVQRASIRGADRSGRDGDDEFKRRPPADRIEGSFKLDGTALSFTTKSSNGIVEYRGAIQADGSLVLDSHSHINGNREKGQRFEFVEVEQGPRRLSEMIPRCIKLDCRKLRSGSVYEHGCGIRADSSGWPLPGEGETVLGRWNVIGSRLFIDMTDDPGFGAYITEGSLGILVTDKSLRGSFYEGKGPVGKLAIVRDVLTFYWPYSLMSEPGVSHYQDDRRLHVFIEDPGQDGHLGLQGITKPKGARADDFLSPVFSVKNRAPEFHEQVCEAWERYHTGAPVDSGGEDLGDPPPPAGRSVAEPESDPAEGGSQRGQVEGAEASPPAAVETGIGGTRFFDLSTAASADSAGPSEHQCASCGTAVGTEDRFCSYCGQDLAAP